VGTGLHARASTGVVRSLAWGLGSLLMVTTWLTPTAVAAPLDVLPIIDPVIDPVLGLVEPVPLVQGMGTLSSLGDYTCVGEDPSLTSVTTCSPIPLTGLGSRGDAVAIMPGAAPGWYFAGWQDCPEQVGDTCVISPDQLVSLVTPTARFEPDTIAPQTTIGGVKPAPVSGVRNASITFTSSEPGTFACQLTGPASGHDIKPCTSPMSYTGLTAGIYTFTVKATDAAGNTDPTPAQHSWKLDTTAPETTITRGPANRSWLLGTTARFGYRSSEGIAFRCFLDGRAKACSGSLLTVNRLSQRTHLFRVAGQDQAGNVDDTPAARSFTVPRDDSSLSRTKGWSKRKGKGYFLNSYSVTRERGATLSSKASGIRRIALVASTAPGNGSVRVFLGKRALKTVSLNSRRTAKRQVVPIAAFGSRRSGVVRIIVASQGKVVRIEGLGIATR
jgi:hypothetical protein